jgi:hypothetical protein
MGSGIGKSFKVPEFQKPTFLISFWRLRTSSNGAGQKCCCPMHNIRDDIIMKSILQKEFDKLHRQGGSPPKFSPKDNFMVTLKYLREYRTMENIEHDYALPDKEVLKEASDTIQYIVVDVTESHIQHPKKTKRVLFWEKNIIR